MYRGPQEVLKLMLDVYINGQLINIFLNWKNRFFFFGSDMTLCLLLSAKQTALPSWCRHNIYVVLWGKHTPPYTNTHTHTQIRSVFRCAGQTRTPAWVLTNWICYCHHEQATRYFTLSFHQHTSLQASLRFSGQRQPFPLERDAPHWVSCLASSGPFRRFSLQHSYSRFFP